MWLSPTDQREQRRPKVPMISALQTAHQTGATDPYNRGSLRCRVKDHSTCVSKPVELLLIEIELRGATYTDDETITRLKKREAQDVQ